MTNEEKLSKLIQIAVENGYEDCKRINWCLANYATIEDLTIVLRIGYQKEQISLNDLVLDFEKDEMSFIEALYGKKDILRNDVATATESQMFRCNWVLKPTSKRLDFLFETFKHLL